MTSKICHVERQRTKLVALSTHFCILILYSDIHSMAANWHVASVSAKHVGS